MKRSDLPKLVKLEEMDPAERARAVREWNELCDANEGFGAMLLAAGFAGLIPALLIWLR